MKLNKLITASVAASVCFTLSCTKLDETELLYDTVTSANFYKTDAELASAVGAAYNNLYGLLGNGNIFSVQEVPSDEIVVPQRGADWGDGGHWVRLKQHAYKIDDPMIINSWNFGFSGVTNCNKLLVAVSESTSPNAPAYVSELKALRAIYYLWLIDLFGNVPITTDFTNVAPPATKPRAEVYAFIEKELLENADALPKEGYADGPFYSRVTYYTAQAALLRLYLNAQVYKGTPEWDKAIATADIIINSGKFALMSNYIDNFKRDNKGSSEFIWAVPYDGVKAGGNNIVMMTLSYLNQDTYKINAQPWNGFATTAEFYKSYIDPALNPGPQGEVVGLSPLGTKVTGTVDKRLSNFLVGPQYAANGTTRLLDGGADLTDPDGPPLTFTPYINELLPNAWRQSGARIGKYQFYTGILQNADNDFPIYRYADVLLMKAEAVARKNNNWNDPVTLAIVNQIRTTHGGVDPLGSLTAESFLAERGREMFAETVRRTDMIRFGTFNRAFDWHAADGDTHWNLFPIPATQINANPNLVQNPGY
ncbi:RagB/SusD family nutrient uptake outer membrane protein [Pollutibacter soli]|uniref:RagB/SusD family nutrient uptake outer membrane protein n=1 Tax=Pollutibacter soli TaxID=3034157 RepID=UPI003013A2AD